MNRYPWWKYAMLAVALVVGLLYTVPNFFGESPAVQVSSGKVTLKVDGGMVPRVEQALSQAGLTPDFVQFDGQSVRARFGDIDTQLKAKDAISRALNPDLKVVARTHSPEAMRLLEGERVDRVFLGEHELAESMGRYLLSLRDAGTSLKHP